MTILVIVIAILLGVFDLRRVMRHFKYNIILTENKLVNFTRIIKIFYSHNNSKVCVSKKLLVSLNLNMLGKKLRQNYLNITT